MPALEPSSRDPEPFWASGRLDAIVSRRARILGPAVWAAAAPDPRPMISFAGGLPDIPSLPGELLAEAARWVVEHEQKEALEYAGTYGPMPLRQAIAARSSRIEGLDVKVEQVMVCSGAAHGIGVVCEALLDPGDVALVESPTFPGSLRTIRSFGVEVVAVPMDEEGLRVDALESKLSDLRAAGRRAKLLYCIPTHQNPAGCTLSLERRTRVLELAREYELLVLEDDAYGELWFSQPPPPSFFALGDGELAVKVCSFSKTLATGLRMGWVMGPAPLLARMASVRYDMGSSPFLGRVIAQLIRTGDLDRHVERLRGIYQRKLERVETAIGRHCAGYCTYRQPLGGFFVWLELRAGLSARQVAAAAWERGVIVGEGAGFHADGNATEHLRLSFSYVAVEDIEEGIHRLGEAMAEVAGRTAPK
jgi:2-aminoadipate transaminase